MIKNDIIYNKDYLVILPIELIDLKEEFEYSFENVFIFNNREKITEQFNVIKQSNFKQIIFVNYLIEYNELVKELKNSCKIKFIFTLSLGFFSDEGIYLRFNSVISLYKEKLIDEIAFCDINLYNTFKDKIKCSHISLNIEKKKRNNSYNAKEIGIINNQDNPVHSFYNELSALKFNDYVAVFDKISERTKDFINIFKINYKIANPQENSIVNLYINFTSNNNTKFIRSMDLGIPCIIGNNELLKDSKLGEYLMVKSDDSIDEINEKIEYVIKNREEILKEYEIFRKEYDKKSSNEINKFLETNNEIESKNEYKKEDYLLSIIVPVYNTEKYLENCLKSILNATINIDEKYEILIINDGSTDNSESIINKYKNKYPQIRYIKQENKGLGNVRNVALKEAKGKYIASIDSDDEIDKNFFTSCLDALKEDIDVVIFNWLSKYDDANYETSAIEWIFKDYNKYEGLLYSSIMPSTCNKIIKKKLYDDLKITFLEDKYEDFSTNPFILLKAKTLKYINKPYYHYYIRKNSLMRSSANLSMINAVCEVSKRIEKYKDLFNIDIEKFKYYTLSWRIEEFIINQAYDLDDEKRIDYIKYMYSKIYDELKDMINNKYYIGMIDKLNKEKKKYILARNEAILNKKLEEFIKKNIKNYYKINAQTIYFGQD